MQSPKFAPPIDFVDQAALSPPEGYKDGGTLQNALSGALGGHVFGAQHIQQLQVIQRLQQQRAAMLAARASTQPGAATTPTPQTQGQQQQQPPQQQSAAIQTTKSTVDLQTAQTQSAMANVCTECAECAECAAKQLLDAGKSLCIHTNLTINMDQGKVVQNLLLVVFL